MKSITWMLLGGLLASCGTGCDKEATKDAAEGQAVAATPKSSSSASPDTSGPLLQFDKTVYDFGTVSAVESVDGKFGFRNAGQGVLKLDQPTTSCGCTVASLKPDTLQPGESGVLTFNLALGNVQSEFEKHITVTSNDPKNPKVELTVRANYTPLYETKPTLLRLEVRDGMETNFDLQVTRTDGKPLNLKGTLSPTPWITADLSGAGQSSSGVIKMKIKAEGAGGSFANYVRFVSDEPNKAVVSVFTVLRVWGDITWSPEVLYWGFTEETRKQPLETLLTRRLLITPTEPGKTFEVSNPSTTLKNASVELVPTEPGRKYEIIVKLAEIPKESASANLSFETNLPKQRKTFVGMTIKVVN